MTPVVNVKNLYLFINDAPSKHARMFFPCKPLQYT